MPYIERMETYGPDLGMPHTKHMGDGLIELRISSRRGTCRVFYCTIKESTITILHSFVKKTQETPRKELNLARKRKGEIYDV